MCPNCTAPECWRPVPYPPFDADYEVSSRGNVRRVGLHDNPRWPVGRLLTLQTDPDGYKRVTFQSNWKDPALRKVKQATVHKMVALVFIGPQPDRLSKALHEDGDPGHNCAQNLYWGTQKQNGADMVRHGRAGRAKGEGNGNAKLTVAIVREIKAALAAGARQVDLARRYDVTRPVICAIAHDRIWRHVT